MSWVFGFCGASDVEGVRNGLGSALLFRLSIPGLYLEAGGIPDTSFYETTPDGSSGWVAVGTGIRLTDSQAGFLTKDDWRSAIAAMPSGRAGIDGHFVALRWNGDKVECFTDQLGLRSLYFAQTPRGVFLSTRLDWVARSAGLHRIDLAALGSRWLMFNQLSYASCVTGIQRLGPGGEACFQSGSIARHSNSPWSPSFSDGQGDGSPILSSLLECGFDTGRTPSLGLSGGLDSRLVLAFLEKRGKRDFAAHTLGDSEDPDVKIADTIAGITGLEHQHFSPPAPDVNSLITILRSYAPQLILTEPVTSIARLGFAMTLHSQNKLMVDGGFGELSRRQFLNRLVTAGKSAIRSRDSLRLMRMMRWRRGDIFSHEATEQMEQAVPGEIEETLETMPLLHEIGIENFVDLFSVRTRLPNQAGPEQALLDSEVLNYMPFAQPSFLRNTFATSVSLRSNGRNFKRLIKQLDPRLTRIPLTKSGLIYPFRLSRRIAWLLLNFKARLGKGFRDPFPDNILHILKEYVFDVAHSKEVTTCDFYDHAKITTAIERYYRGDADFRSSVDWWLAFELWRQSLHTE